MIVGLSPDTGSTPDTAPADAIHYLMATTVWKTVNRRKVFVTRNPAPELLIGRPDLCLATLQHLSSKHLYGVATLSFAEADIPVAAFNDGDPDLRLQVGQTLRLFFEVAYAGLPEKARLRPLVGTHTHTGRLEVNILMPRAVWRVDGRLRAWNPHPPGKVSRALWDRFRDTVNHRFEWADPLCPSRRRKVAPLD